MPSSLSADTKDALAREVPDAAHCREALLYGLSLYGTNPQGQRTTRRRAIARLFRSLTLALPLSHSNAADAGAPKPAHRCDRVMEIRAAFLSCGSLSGGGGGYHLEFFPPTGTAAERL